jgi:hypothetical protein
MANTFKFGTDGNWAVKEDYALAYNDENGNFKPLPFDFTRASTATRVNKDGLVETVPSGKPRIDFLDNTSGHLLLEPSRTNLVTRSEDFSDSSWFKNANTSVSVNTATSPTGENNATTLTISTAFPALYDTITTTASTDYTFTFYVKNKNISDITYRVYDASNAADIISPTSYYSQIGDDWTRISISFTTPSGCLSTRVYLCSDNSGVGEVYIWGAQVEEGSYATSIIKTEGSTVTRSAETANGAGNSTVFNDSEGVLYAEIAALADDGTARRMSISDSTTSNRVVLMYHSTSNVVRGFVSSGGSLVSDMTYTVSDTTQVSKIAFSYKQDDFKIFIDGVQRTTDDSGNAPTGLKELAFDDGNGANDFYGKIKDLRVYDTALSDSELQALTS